MESHVLADIRRKYADLSSFLMRISAALFPCYIRFLRQEHVKVGIEHIEFTAVKRGGIRADTKIDT